AYLGLKYCDACSYKLERCHTCGQEIKSGDQYLAELKRLYQKRTDNEKLYGDKEKLYAGKTKDEMCQILFTENRRIAYRDIRPVTKSNPVIQCNTIKTLMVCFV